MRLIDADALEKVVEDTDYDVISRDWSEPDGFSADVVFNMIADAPTVKTANHGHWIYCGQDDTTETYMQTIQDYVNNGGKPEEWRPETFFCSHCLKGFDWNDHMELFSTSPNYCPNCGTKMNEDVKA